MIKDVRHPLRRLVEVHRNRHAARSIDRKIRRVPLRTIRRKKTHTVTSLHPQLHQGVGEPRHPPQEFLRRNLFPFPAPAHHLRPGSLKRIHRIQQPCWQTLVVHGLPWPIKSCPLNRNVPQPVSTRNVPKVFSFVPAPSPPGEFRKSPAIACRSQTTGRAEHHRQFHLKPTRHPPSAPSAAAQSNQSRRSRVHRAVKFARCDP